MNKTYVCEECEIPMESEADYGINKDGSKNTTFCISCWNKNKSTLLKFAYFLDYFDWILVGVFYVYGMFFMAASPPIVSFIMLIFSLFFTVVCIVTFVLVVKYENYYRRKRHLIWPIVQLLFWLAIDVYFVLTVLGIIDFDLSAILEQIVAQLELWRN